MDPPLLSPSANNPFWQRATPVTGNTVTATPGINGLTLEIVPAGTLATLTVVFPTSPVDGQSFTLKISQIITTLTVTGTVAGSPGGGATVAGYSRTFVYDALAASWV